MASIYLFVQGMPGGITLFSTRGWCEIYSYTWGQLGVSGSSGMGNVGGVEKVCNVVRLFDILSSTWIHNHVVSGEHVGTVVAYVAGSPGMTTTMHDCTLVSHGAGGPGSGPPTESFSFEFKDIVTSRGTPVQQLVQIFTGGAQGPGRFFRP